jgi:hypothetical protein
VIADASAGGNALDRYLKEQTRCRSKQRNCAHFQTFRRETVAGRAQMLTVWQDTVRDHELPAPPPDFPAGRRT